MKDDQAIEITKCFSNPLHFIVTYVKIYDAVAGDWIPFALWPAQRRTLTTMLDNLLVIVLKARQLGLTWLVLAYALWLMLFRPSAEIGLFSRRETESIYLLSEERLRGMYKRLPDWMKVGVVETVDSAKLWKLSNGSVARAFPTSAGDSYTFTLAIVDEADLAPDLNKLMRAVKPTIDNGGQMLLVSRVDKTHPESEFKNIYRAAKQKLNDWVAVFLPWQVHPRRDQVWYERQQQDIQSRTGSLDDLYEQYPSTDAEALAEKTLDKRIPPQHLQACFFEMRPLDELPPGCPVIPGLEVYAQAVLGRSYVITGDPAEGNPTSDDSACTVFDAETLEEVAAFAGKFEPAAMAYYIDTLGRYYYNARVMVERNNHGHAVLLWLRDNSNLHILHGHDGKPGWLSSSKGKAILYDKTAEAFKDGDTILHSVGSYYQLASIDGSTLRAPEGKRDDRADSYALGVVAVRFATRVAGAFGRG